MKREYLCVGGPLDGQTKLFESAEIEFPADNRGRIVTKFDEPKGASEYQLIGIKDDWVFNCYINEETAVKRYCELRGVELNTRAYLKHCHTVVLAGYYTRLRPSWLERLADCFASIWSTAVDCCIKNTRR